MRAFLARFAEDLPALGAFSLGWNGAQDVESWPQAWAALREELPRIAERTSTWRGEVLAHGDLATKLLDFARELGRAQENRI